MLMTKKKQLIDENLDVLKQWGCDKICVKSSCYCENNNPVSRYVCYKLNT